MADKNIKDLKKLLKQTLENKKNSEDASAYLLENIKSGIAEIRKAIKMVPNDQRNAVKQILDQGILLQKKAKLVLSQNKKQYQKTISKVEKEIKLLNKN